MAVQFAVLASGSRGNSALIRGEGGGLLVDLGLGPRALGRRLESLGLGWDHVGAAVLTHTHGDHVDTGSLNLLAKLRVPFYCHDGHRPALARLDGFHALDAAGMVRHYDDRPFLAPTGHRVEPLELKHDGGPTYGFRVEAKPSRGRKSVAIGYLSDTGCWNEIIADGLTDVDLLGVEFNHDVEMQRRSHRHPALIARNLGDRGHLSNRQAADLVADVLGRSGRGSLRHVVMLHLSSQCNDPGLAVREARAAIRGAGRRVQVHTALQDFADPVVWVTRNQASRGVPKRTTLPGLLLPGFSD